MKHQSARRSALLSAAVPACLFLTACEPTNDTGNNGPPRFHAPLPPPRRAVNTDPENARWLAAWRDLRAQLAPLEEKLAAAQKMHFDYHFDAFLALDPATIGTEQLCSLFHFLERGYFTVERQVLIQLLERRLERATTPVTLPTGDRSTLKDRLAAALHRDELRMVDLETALQFYRQPGDDTFQIPAGLTEEEESELRTTVTDMLTETQDDITKLDASIETLKTQVFGNGTVQNPEPSESPKFE